MFKSILEKVIKKQINLHQLSVIHLQSSRLTYLLMMFQTMQLSAIIIPSVQITQIANFSQFVSLFKKWLTILLATCPTSWVSLATSNSLEILFLCFLSGLLFFQIAFIAYSLKGTKAESSKLIMLCYNIFGLIFEYVFSIPILMWIMYKNIPSEEGFLQNVNLYKTPNSYYIAIISMFCVCVLLHLAGKLVYFPFRQFGQDRLKSRYLEFDFINLLVPYLIVILTSQAQNQHISYLIPNVVSCFYGFVLIALGLLNFTSHPPFVKKMADWASCLLS